MYIFFVVVRYRNGDCFQKTPKRASLGSYICDLFIYFSVDFGKLNLYLFSCTEPGVLISVVLHQRCNGSSGLSHSKWVACFCVSPLKITHTAG